MPARLNVAFVAPSVAILGGQAVQASRLLQWWGDDRDVRAWLVPINPDPPRGLAFATRVKYLRTVVTQMLYWPLVLRELRHADVVHVFSASYCSFLLAPLPAVLIAKLYGRPVVLNYRSGEAPDHLKRSAIARATLRWVEANVVPSLFLHNVFAAFGIASEIVPNIVDLERFRFRRRDPLRPRIVSTRNFEPLYNMPCTLRAFRLVQERYPDATLTLVGGGSEEAAMQRLAEKLRLEHVTFAGRVRPEDIWQYYADADIYLQTPDRDPDGRRPRPARPARRRSGRRGRDVAPARRSRALATTCRRGARELRALSVVLGPHPMGGTVPQSRASPRADGADAGMTMAPALLRLCPIERGCEL